MRGRPNRSMVVMTIHLPKEYVDVLKAMVERRLYPNIAEAIRTAVRDLIVSECHLVGADWPRGESERRSDDLEDF